MKDLRKFLLFGIVAIFFSFQEANLDNHNLILPNLVQFEETSLCITEFDVVYVRELSIFERAAVIGYYTHVFGDFSIHQVRGGHEIWILNTPYQYEPNPDLTDTEEEVVINNVEHPDNWAANLVTLQVKESFLCRD